MQIKQRRTDGKTTLLVSVLINFIVPFSNEKYIQPTMFISHGVNIDNRNIGYVVDETVTVENVAICLSDNGLYLI